MIRISHFEEEFEDSYFSYMDKKYEDSKKSVKYENLLKKSHSCINEIIKYLDLHKKEIIIGKPETLLMLIHDYHKKLPTIKKYLERKNKTKNIRTKIDNALKIINMLFDYSAFSNKNNISNKKRTHTAYSLVKMHDLRICPYCHLNHINYHYDDENPNSLMLRPPFDHFYPDSLYPWLAISLYNLIPCCEQCNSRIKLAQDPTPVHLLSPFTKEEIEIDLIWEYNLPLSTIEEPEDFTFTLAGFNARSVQHENFFKLNARYHWYEPEIMDLVDKIIKFNALPNTKIKEVITIRDYVYPFNPIQQKKKALGIFTAKFIEILIKHNEDFPRR